MFLGRSKAAFNQAREGVRREQQQSRREHEGVVGEAAGGSSRGVDCLRTHGGLKTIILKLFRGAKALSSAAPRK